MRRAQAEIIGLLLIVVLIAIGFLLYIRFSSSGSGSTKAAFEQNQMGQTFVNSLVLAQVTCDGRLYQVRDLLRDVATGTAPDTCGDGRTPERLLNATFSDVLDGTLGAWGVNYRFLVLRTLPDGSEEPLSAALPELRNAQYAGTGTCDATYRPRVAIGRTVRPLGLAGAGEIEVRLEECREKT